MQILILALISVLTGAELDIFVPSFTIIKQQFNIGTCTTELMISVNLVAQCIGCIMTGSLSNKFGSKRIMIISLTIFTIGSILCAMATSYDILLYGRVLQGIGIAAPSVLIFSVLASNFSEQKQHSLIGLLSGFGSLSMAFAPVVGGYITHYYEWRTNFAVLAVGGLMATMMSFFIKDKFTGNRKLKISLAAYKPIISSGSTMLYIVTIALMAQPYYVFVSIAPILYVDDLGMSVATFSVLQGILALCFAIVSISSAYITKILGKQLFFRISMFLIALSTIFLAMILCFDVNNPYYLTAVMSILSVGMVLPINEIFLLALNSIPGEQNSISGTVSIMKLMLTSITVQMAGYWHNDSFFTTGLISFIFLIATLGIIAFLQIKDQRFNKNFYLKV